MSSLEKRIFQGNITAAFQYLKGTYRKNGQGLFIRKRCDRTRDDGFNLKRVPFRLGIREKLFTQKVVSIQGQIGWGSEQSNLVSGNPDHGRGAGTR